MAQYKNSREAVLGDEVVGVAADGKTPVAGKLVMIHKITGKDATNGAVSQDFKLVGDCKLSEFLHFDDTPEGKLVKSKKESEKSGGKPSTPSPSTPS